jgi:hypothetical protein
VSFCACCTQDDAGRMAIKAEFLRGFNGESDDHQGSATVHGSDCEAQPRAVSSASARCMTNDYCRSQRPARSAACAITCSSFVSNVKETSVTSFRPNCPKSDEGWSYSTIVCPAFFSYTSTRSGA